MNRVKRRLLCVPYAITFRNSEFCMTMNVLCFVWFSYWTYYFPMLYKQNPYSKVEKFTLEQCAKTERQCRCVAVLFNLCARWWCVFVTPRLLYPQERNPVPVWREAGYAPWPMWTSAGNLTSTGIRFPDRSARSPYAISDHEFLQVYNCYINCLRSVTVEISNCGYSCCWPQTPPVLRSLPIVDMWAIVVGVRAVYTLLNLL
jgi:hypothetical protein